MLLGWAGSSSTGSLGRAVMIASRSVRSLSCVPSGQRLRKLSYIHLIPTVKAGGALNGLSSIVLLSKNIAEDADSTRHFVNLSATPLQNYQIQL